MLEKFDRSVQNIGNILLMEHVNLAVDDQQVAIAFYVGVLGLTRDPYISVGLNNIWINVGRQQFHLPTSEKAQVLRGEIGLIIPSLEQLRVRLENAEKILNSTQFSWSSYGHESISITCPWGNRFICKQANSNLTGMRIGISHLNFYVNPNSAKGISRFYKEILDAPCELVNLQNGLQVAVVKIGPEQSIVFSEDNSDRISPYDGHHIAVYVADFSNPHHKIESNGFITEESNKWQYRFESIYDPLTKVALFDLEHEVRSITHPMYSRKLINRNPGSNLQNFLRDSEDLNIN